MNDLASEPRKPTQRKFWILLLVIMASLGSFGMALYGVLYGAMGAFAGAISIGLMPFAGEQIAGQMDETSSNADLMVNGGVIAGIVFLVLFFVLRRRLE